jgi:hypothetical protein
MNKRIEAILPPPPTNMVGDGFRVHHLFPGSYRLGSKISPFFMMDYNAPVVFPPSEKPRGVGVHPHRGFETVTIAYRGKVAHHDSMGNSGIIGPGDVQWMTAGSGVLHKEYHEEEFSKTGGEFQMVQLWVNLPQQYKMTTPKYQTLLSSQHGKFYPDQQGSVVDIIAGEWNGVRGSAQTFTPIQLWNIQLAENAEFSFSIPENFNAAILIIEGEVNIHHESLAPTNHLLLFSNEGKEITLRTSKKATCLLLAGEPIDEPVVHYGPFLMNTVEEIHQAFDDLNAGKFGYLED